MSVTITEKVLNAFLNVLRDSFEIHYLNIEITHKDETVLSVTATGKQTGGINIDIEKFITDLPPIKTKLVINIKDVIKAIYIMNNSIIKHKIYKRFSNLEQIDSVSMKFTTECDIDTINHELFKLKDTNPQLKIITNSDQGSSNVIADKNIVLPANKSSQEYKKYCRYVSESIASTISYSINHNFRSKCLKIVNGDCNQFWSVQQVIQEKLENLEK